MNPDVLIRNLVIGVGRIGGRALAKAAQSVAQDGIAVLGQAQQAIKRTHDKLENIVEAPTVPSQSTRAPTKRV